MENVWVAQQRSTIRVPFKGETLVNIPMNDFSNLSLREVESVEIISLVDNAVDYLSTIERKEVKSLREWIKERMPDKWIRKHFSLPMAEHGFSMLIRVLDGKNCYSMLFDVGYSPDGMVRNAERIGINLAEIECIALSHGHYDHFGGLLAAVKAIDKNGLPVIVHEDMLRIRGVARPDGTVRKYPKFPTEEEVKPARYIKTKEPYLLANDRILVTGEIPRKTSFEKGYPKHRVFRGGEWHPDPWIWDDRALIINVKQKGLVILSGCAHAGIINTVLYAQHLTTVDRVYAVIGGFHLAGKEYEGRIDRTVEELKKMNVEFIAPSHCTGWRGIFAIAEAMPHAFVWNSVGNLYRF
jgi:7,8-dihydropterin-6-yl-methyl-4-(beta-D-ribofuranosyl)aminobenzene 5'-phosphate synthase